MNLWIQNDAGVSTYMGHANISITLDRYGHLMPGNESEAAELLDAYLSAQRERVDDAARAARGKPWEKWFPIRAVLSGPQRSILCLRTSDRPNPRTHARMYHI